MSMCVCVLDIRYDYTIIRSTIPYSIRNLTALFPTQLTPLYTSYTLLLQAHNPRRVMSLAHQLTTRLGIAHATIQVQDADDPESCPCGEPAADLTG